RPVQRERRGDVLEVVGLHEPQQSLQPAAVQLEDAQGVTARQQPVRLRIVEGQLLEIQVDVLVETDVLDRIGDDREVPQPQEVHLDETQALGRRVVELRD